jgi:hypothetical protein
MKDTWTFSTNATGRDWGRSSAPRPVGPKFATRWDAIVAGFQQLHRDFEESKGFSWTSNASRGDAKRVISQLERQTAGMALLYAPAGTLKDHLCSKPLNPKETAVMAKTANAKKPRANASAAKAAKAKQKKIPNTFDPVPQDLQDKVEEYVESLGEWQQSQKRTDTLREEVIELMKEHDVESVPLDEDTKVMRVHKDETWTIKKVKIKHPKPATSASGNGDAGYDTDEGDE